MDDPQTDVVLPFRVVGGMNVEGMDAKTALNQYCQRHCSRPVTKHDIVYTTTKFGSIKYQAIVKLNCMQGQEYAGELCHNPKLAEKSAALQALQAYREVTLPAPMTGAMKKKQRAVDEAASPADKPDASSDNPAVTEKVNLNATCMRIAKRALEKGETVYDTQAVGGKTPNGYTATVQLKCLPGEWANRIFQGEVKANKQMASQSVAGVALAEILADPELSVLAGRPPRNGASKGKGKGYAKGKGQGWWGKGYGPDLPREDLSEDLVGEVLEWKGTFGWIKPPAEVEHPFAGKHGGRIYVHEQDIQPLQELQVGARVQFQLYADDAGLGAQKVVAM